MGEKHQQEETRANPQAPVTNIVTDVPKKGKGGGAEFYPKWPTTTRHLRVLQNAGLIRNGGRGRSRVYTVDKSRLDLVKEWLGWFDPPPP